MELTPIEVCKCVPGKREKDVRYLISFARCEN